LLEGECNTFILSAQRDGEGSNPLSLSEKNMNKYLRKKLRLLIEFKCDSEEIKGLNMKMIPFLPMAFPDFTE
jgi:hypothetical protein